LGGEGTGGGMTDGPLNRLIWQDRIISILVATLLFLISWALFDGILPSPNKLPLSLFVLFNFIAGVIGGAGLYILIAAIFRKYP
jgi:hypothetical protein